MYRIAYVVGQTLFGLDHTNPVGTQLEIREQLANWESWKGRVVRIEKLRRGSWVAVENRLSPA